LARLSAVVCTSHSPFLYAPPEQWELARSARASAGGIAPTVAIDSGQANADKHARCMAALDVLKARLQEARPDVILVFGDDQSEQFGFDNFPAFCVYAGEQFSGFKVSGKFGLPVPKVAREDRPRTPEHWADVPGHPDFAKALLIGLLKSDFDVGFSLALPRPEEGIGHAFTRPFVHLAPEFDIPTVPFFVNCYFGPQPTGRRCAQLGRAVRQVIESMPEDLNVVIIGSGGLWHTPMFPESILDEAFDTAILDGVRAGDADAMATYFDSRDPQLEPDDTAGTKLYSGGTGMILGFGAGTGETRNWIVAAAAAGNTPGTVIDYVPAYASPVGLAFAYWSFT